MRSRFTTMRNLLLLTVLTSILLTVGCEGTVSPEPEDRPASTVARDTFEAEPPQYVIRQNRFYGLVQGELITDAGDRLKRATRNDGEGAYTIYRILGDDGEDIGYVVPSVADASRIGDIHVTARTAATEGDIRVGHTYARLRIAYPALEVRGADTEGRTFAYTKNKAFRLADFTSRDTDIDEGSVPPETKISEIVVIDRATGQALEI